MEFSQGIPPVLLVEKKDLGCEELGHSDKKHKGSLESMCMIMKLILMVLNGLEQQECKTSNDDAKVINVFMLFLFNSPLY